MAPNDASSATSRLTPDDWAAAALDAIEEGGINAVAIEAIARKLGATKGSCYWHFADRNDLIRAALELWERGQTGAIVRELQGVRDPLERFARLRSLELRPDLFKVGVEAALLADADHPVVAPVLRRVLEARIAFLQRLFRDAGFSAAEARHRALFALSAFLGRSALARAAPELLPAGRALRTHLERTAETLLAEER